jgi:hypothetical protein
MIAPVFEAGHHAFTKAAMEETALLDNKILINIHGFPIHNISYFYVSGLNVYKYFKV